MFFGSLSIYKIIFMVELLVAELLFTFRLGKRSRFVLRFALVSAACIVVSVFFPVLSYDAIYSSVLFLVLFLVSMAGLMFCYNEKPFNIVYCAIAAYTVRHLSFQLFSLCMTFIDGTNSSVSDIYSGTGAGVEVLGAKEEELYAYVKHFAANETTRAGGYTWMTEQALRENYLKPFKAAVKDGGTLGIMSAYNRIGSTRTSGSYNLLTELLREEWGFEGCVVSDYNNGEPILCPDEAIRAGNDLMMEVSGSKSMFRDRTSATAIASLHRGAKNVVYCYVAAQYSMATSSGLDLTTLVSTQVSSDVFPWWIILLVVIDVIAAAGAAFWCVMVIRSLRKKRAARS